MRTVTYGIGGFDPNKPNGNIIEEVEQPDPEPVEEVEPTTPTRYKVEEAVAVSVVADNDAWLANPSKELIEQVKALTRQVNALMGKTESVEIEKKEERHEAGPTTEDS